MMGVLQTLGFAGLLWLTFLAAFVAFILLLYWPVERRKRFLRWCPACRLAGRGRYCENCSERLVRTRDRRPTCFHCGAFFEKEVPKFCHECGFSQGPRVGEKAAPKQA